MCMPGAAFYGGNFNPNRNVMNVESFVKYAEARIFTLSDVPLGGRNVVLMRDFGGSARMAKITDCPFFEYFTGSPKFWAA